MKDKLTLVGFSGSGKSVVSQSLLNKFGIVCVDLDVAIEEFAGKRVPEIIRVEGENAFRALEAQVLASLLKERDDIDVIALGGGALLNAGNRELVAAKSFSVELRAPEDELVRRVLADEKDAQLKGSGPLRPLLVQDHDGLDEQIVADAVSQLKLARAGLYDSADCVVWTHAATADCIAARIIDEWKVARQKSIKYCSSFPVSIQSKVIEQQLVTGDGSLQTLGSRVRQVYPDATKIALVIDENVLCHWEEAVIGALSDWKVSIHRVESGETSKCFTVLERLADELLEAGISRRDLIVACGGGVVGDLSGYLASSFMRGVGLVHVPTTLIAQVDSAIGGKTGVNLKGGKNLMGTFNPAPLTLNDPAFLSTLPEREFKAGLGEVVKYGLIGSADFFEWLCLNRDKVASRNLESLREVIEYCGRAKLEIVAVDLEDRLGQRALLNFGHTVGHAVESLAGYGNYLHGEAVSIGMVFALALGAKLGLGSSKIVDRAVDLLASFELPVEIPSELLKQSLLPRWGEALRADKKKISDAIDFVIVKEIGVSTTVNMEMETVIEAIDECMTKGTSRS